MVQSFPRRSMCSPPLQRNQEKNLFHSLPPPILPYKWIPFGNCPQISPGGVCPFGIRWSRRRGLPALLLVASPSLSWAPPPSSPPSLPLPPPSPLLLLLLLASLGCGNRSHEHIVGLEQNRSMLWDRGRNVSLCWDLSVYRQCPPTSR